MGIGLVINEISGECDKEHAKRSHQCDVAWIVSPVPLGFEKPGDYWHLVYFIVTTLGAFFWWWFSWPDHYDFYDQGMVEVNNTVGFLQTFFPSTAKLILFRDVVSAAPGKSTFNEPNFQIKVNTMYKIKILKDQIPEISADVCITEPLTYTVSVQGQLREKVSGILES